jgi:hypothetical protein
MRKAIVTLAIATLAFVTLAIPAQCGQTVRRDRQLIIIVAQGATLEDISAANLPNFRRLFDTGACALMTTRTAGDSGGKTKSDTGNESACLTLGAGSRAVAGMEARNAYDYDESVGDTKAADIYQRLFLIKPPIGSVVMVDANEITRNNSHLPYRLGIGAIGGAMRNAGLLTACVGNSDTIQDIHREAAGIAIDGSGIVDMGDVSRKLLRRNASGPYGIETSLRALINAFDRVGRANLIVVDAGDMARADWYGNLCFRPQAMAMRQWAALRTDLVLGEVLKRVDLRSSRIMFVSPCSPHWQLYSNRRMAPVLIVGEGITHGLITSGSTRRPGLITNTDIAAGVLGYFGLKIPPSVIGRPPTSMAKSNPLSFLVAVDAYVTQQNDRLILMRLMATVLTFVIIAVLLLRRWPEVTSRLALVPAMVAPLMAILPLFGSYTVMVSGAILAGMAVVIALLILLLRIRAVHALIGLCAALCLIVAADLFRGGTLLANSPFSYSPSEGARFYGLGNEMSGSLVGAAIVVVFGLVGPLVGRMPGIRRLRTLICVACFGGLAVLAGAPTLGADTGGALASLAVAAAALGVLASGKMTTKRWLIVIGASVAAFGLIAVLDHLRGTGGETHLGKAFELVTSGRAAEFGLIIARKVGMNLKLLQSSMWSKLLLVSVGAMVYLRATSRGKRPIWTAQAVKLIAVGALVAFLVNDSGVVGAATCLVYAWSLEAITRSSTEV